MKIFIGSVENCGILNGLSYGFKKLGHEVTSFVKTRDSFFKNCIYDYDMSNFSISPSYFKKIPLLKSAEFRAKNFILRNHIKNIFFKDLIKNDVFIFTCSTILNNLKDLAILKKHNKKIVFIFIGSEIRYALAFNQQFPGITIPWPSSFINENLNKKLEFIRTIEFYADSIHALPDLSGLLIKPYNLTYVPYILDNKIFKIPDNNIVKIVHAPSNRNLKGTSIILDTIDRLKKEKLNFEFKIIENQPNEIVIQELLDADIAIDQLYLHYPGIFATEAMAMGCAVATHSYEHETNFFHPPICNINENNVYEKLKYLIEHRDYRIKLANEGRSFVQENNSPELVANKILEGLLHSGHNEFKPTFYLNNFIKRQDEHISNKVKSFTKQVITKYYDKHHLEIYESSLEQRGLL